MAKKNKRDKSASPGKKVTPSKKEKKSKKQEESETKKKLITLEAVEAMSSSDDGSVDQNNKAWNAKAQALEKLIKGGAYDKVASKLQAEEDEESVEEVVLGDEEEEEEKPKTKKKSPKKTVEKKKAVVEEKGDSSDEEKEEENDKEEESGEESEEEEEDSQQALFDLNSKALLAKTEELLAEKKGFPWVEKFDIYPTTPLPFGTIDEETGNKIDVHDDLKREVAFYNIAMEAVEIARTNCKEDGVPFSRPDDFFAEMVKSDDHMARVKDRLIFENKKIDAVTQRKSNKEQKLRSKEAHSNKIAEKSRRRKDNLKAVDDWAQGAAANRGGKYSDKDDQKFLSTLSSSGGKRPWTDRDGNLQTGPNKKRMVANKKYGHGGKRGRFKQNDAKSMNDMSGFNPRGNFGGLGTKKSAGGAGGNRQGKRARDAGRSRQGS